MIKSLLCVLLLIFDFTLFNVATENNKSEKHRSSPSEENPETESATTTETKATISVENSENVEPLLHKEQNSKGDNLSSAKQVYYIKKVEECKVRSTPLDMIEVHITTRIQGGMELDSSYTSPGGKPLKLGLLGDKNVNALDKAMMGMCEGETVRVAVPVHEVFDKKKLEQAPFPADSILEYDIDLITVIKPPLNEDSFEIIDVDEDGQVSKDEFKEYLEDIGFEEESHFMLDSFFKYKDKSNNSFITMEELKLPYEEAVEEPRHEEL